MDNTASQGWLFSPSPEAAMPAESSASVKIFVLDTNVILHDSGCIHNFAEHDIAIPITVLEELDKFKRGNEDINFQAREFLRFAAFRREDADHTGPLLPLGGKQPEAHLDVLVAGAGAQETARRHTHDAHQGQKDFAHRLDLREGSVQAHSDSWCARRGNGKAPKGRQ